MNGLDEIRARFANTTFANRGITPRDVRRLITRVEKLEKALFEIKHMVTIVDDEVYHHTSEEVARIALEDDEK